MVLSKYVDMMKDVWKEKDPATRNSKKAEIDADPNTKELKTFYRDIIEKIKTFCPNLIDELGYKPWTPEQTTRIQAWIDTVLAGNDPTSVGSVPTVAATIGNDIPVNNTPSITPQAPAYTANAPMVDDEDEDLPF